MFNTEFFLKTFLVCLKAIPVTLEITLVSFLLSVLPSYAIAMGRLKNRPVVKKVGALYVSFMRGTPVVLQILIVYSILPSLLNAFFKKFFPSVNIFDMNPIVYAFIVFTLNTTATLSEIFRSAMLSVDKGQYEAALCAGLSHFHAYRRIIFPQALGCALPNICNLTVNLIKNTSLAFMMTVKDITAVAKIEASYGFNYIEAYLDIFVIYLLVCSIVQFFFRLAEKKSKKSGVKNVKSPRY